MVNGLNSITAARNDKVHRPTPPLIFGLLWYKYNILLRYFFQNRYFLGPCSEGGLAVYFERGDVGEARPLSRGTGNKMDLMSEQNNPDVSKDKKSEMNNRRIR